MDQTSKFSLVTKRLVIGHVSDLPRMLLRERRQRQTSRSSGLAQGGSSVQEGLLKRVQLSISGCLGPCDIPNVVTISDDSGTQWLGE